MAKPNVLAAAFGLSTHEEKGLSIGKHKRREMALCAIGSGQRREGPARGGYLGETAGQACEKTWKDYDVVRCPGCGVGVERLRNRN